MKLIPYNTELDSQTIAGLPHLLSIFASLLVSIVLVTSLRFYCSRRIARKAEAQYASTRLSSDATSQEKGSLCTDKEQPAYRPPWLRLPAWRTLPPINLPLSLTLPRKEMVGVGVGLRGPSSEAPNPAVPSGLRPQTPQMSQTPGGARVSNFRPPAVYQSEVPISMAKIIMSRHTLRRSGAVRAPPRRGSISSTPLPPPRTSSPVSQLEQHQQTTTV
ncbi:hypothetical protein FISHEDRAFT_75722 [Fistulina hepatica ATCC 64428]|uniref:Uncharacterized protein n=1 Tax=Fistulina hepatica ATCC 64428 TaxID=1128425 RepID=A0A0D7A7P4_9AGAR|nr:hypothetical protein FISHEDRAFT_75722 [Fistulina hepatica ATCC 64428]